MKRIVIATTLALFALGTQPLSAQNSSGNGNGNNVQNGISFNQAVHILQVAHSRIGNQLSMSLGQMIQAYKDGDITIEIGSPSTAILRKGGAVADILDWTFF
jgi:hypothetical protein